MCCSQHGGNERSQAGTATAASSPIFATPRGGIGAFVRATADAVVAAGGRIITDAPVTAIGPTGDGSWSLSLPVGVGSERTGDTPGHDSATFDAVVFATPAAATASALAEHAPDAARLLGYSTDRRRDHGDAARACRPVARPAFTV